MPLTLVSAEANPRPLKRGLALPANAVKNPGVPLPGFSYFGASDLFCQSEFLCTAITQFTPLLPVWALLRSPQFRRRVRAFACASPGGHAREYL
jgi:hypothetical protein